MGQREPDVLVIGAGIIGCSVAFELAEAGAAVRVIDARTPGAGASQASAGVLAPYVEGHGSPVLRALGRRSLDLYPRFVERVVAGSGRAVEFERLGTLEVAITADEKARLDRSAALLAANGVQSHWIAPPALADLEPELASQAIGGLQIPLHAVVHVPNLTAALVAAAVRLGAEFSTGVAVSRLAADGDGIAVHTATEVFRAGRVVIAAGTWAPSLVPPGSSPLPVRPVRGQLLHLAAAPRTLRHVVWGADVYLVPWQDGTIFAGATSEDVGFDERTTASGVAVPARCGHRAGAGAGRRQLRGGPPRAAAGVAGRASVRRHARRCSPGWSTPAVTTATAPCSRR